MLDARQKPITFESARGLQYTITTTREREVQQFTGKSVLSHTRPATDADLHTAGYVRVPSEQDLAGAILVAIDEAQPGDDGHTALAAARAVRKALGVAT